MNSLIHQRLAIIFVSRAQLIDTSVLELTSNKNYNPIRAGLQVRALPTPALYRCIPTGTHGPTCIFWADLTHFGEIKEAAVVVCRPNTLVAAAAALAKQRELALLDAVKGRIKRRHADKPARAAAGTAGV
jgi:hypothetical protein